MDGMTAYILAKNQTGASADSAAASAAAAASSATDAEAYAIGKRNGADVGSSDPAYHNNSRYWAGQAESITDLQLAVVDGALCQIITT